MPLPHDIRDLSKVQRNITMQPSNGSDMDYDGFPVPSCSSPTLATPGTVLPHSDIETKQLADQASHLTLATSFNKADASLASGLYSGVPAPSRSRSRTCSACSSSTTFDGPLPLKRASARASPNRFDAQRAPLRSHEHAREETSMSAAGGAAGDERDCHQMHLADVAPLVLVRTSSGPSLADLPNEVLLHILGHLDVCDLLLLSRVSLGNVVTCSSLRPSRVRMICCLFSTPSHMKKATVLPLILLPHLSSASLPSRTIPHLPTRHRRPPKLPTLASPLSLHHACKPADQTPPRPHRHPTNSAPSRSRPSCTACACGRPRARCRPCSRRRRGRRSQTSSRAASPDQHDRRLAQARA